MGDPHLRNMDGSWNPGDVWPVPVECLLNGVTSDAHLMFGSEHVFPPHFRHRVHAPVHLSSHVPSLPGSIDISVPLSQNSLGGPNSVDEACDASIGIQGGHGQNMHVLAEMEDGDDLEDSDDCPEEEDDDIRDLEQAQNEHSLNMISLAHTMENEVLPQCQQDVGNNLQQSSLLVMEESHIQTCIEKHKPSNGIMQDELVNSANPLILSTEDDFANPNSSSNDPNTGFSVQGKIYFEGRVVLHLKQWSDTNLNGNHAQMDNPAGFSTCEGQHQHKGQFHGCAVCHLKHPHESHRNQKQAHRHTVRGVLFTFEDCIIVELYPEQLTANTIAGEPKPSTPGMQPARHSKPAATYMDSLIESPDVEAKKFLGQIQVQATSASPLKQHDLTHPQPAEDDNDWWDEFESSDDIKRHEEHLTENSPVTNMSLKMSCHEANNVDDRENCVNSYVNIEMDSHSDVACDSSAHSVEAIEITAEIHTASTDMEVTCHSGLTTIKLNKESPNQSNVLANGEKENVEDHEIQGNSCSKLLSCATTLNTKELYQNLPEDVRNKESPICCNKCKLTFIDVKHLRKHKCNPPKQKKKLCSDPKTRKILLKPEFNSRNVKTRNKDSFPHNKRDKDKPCNISVQNKTDSQITEDSPNCQEKIQLELPQGSESDSCKKVQRNGEKRSRRTEKPYQCEICAKAFTVERRLQNHMLSHTSERCSQCEKCGKQFQRKDKLMRHMYVHSEEKMFSCEICLKRFSRRDKLRDHLKSHGGEDEIHNCPMCEKQFLRPDILKQHVKLHTLRNKYQCSECLRFVTGKERLDKHMARHQEAKALGEALLCPLCTKYFIQKQSLKAHIRKFHPNSSVKINSPDSELDDHQPMCQSSNTTGDEKVLPNKSASISRGHNTNKKQMNCRKCSKVFSKRQTFKKHVHTHDLSPASSNLLSIDSLDVVSSERNPADKLTMSTSKDISDVSSKITSSLQTSLLQSSSSTNSTSENNSSSFDNALHSMLQSKNSLHCTEMKEAVLEMKAPTDETHQQMSPEVQAQMTSLVHSVDHVHANLTQQISIPVLQHHVNMTAQQSLCNSPFVLTYPTHYAYQL